jgi:hypothetical protein
MSWSAEAPASPVVGMENGMRLPHHGVSIEVSAGRLADGRSIAGRLRFDREGLTWRRSSGPGARMSVPLRDIRAIRLVGAALEVEAAGTAYRFGGDGGRRIYAALVECLMPEAA